MTWLENQFNHLSDDEYYDLLMEKEKQREANVDAESWRDKRTPAPGYVYLLEAENNIYKIGRSRDLKTRVLTIQMHSPVKVILLHRFQSKNSIIAEETLHKKYAAKRKHGEWFDLNDREVNEIKAILDYQL